MPSLSDYKVFTVENATADVNLYTVPSGKTFHVTDVFLVVRNTDTANAGRFAITEDNGERIPGAVSTATAGTSAPQIVADHHFSHGGMPFAADKIVKFRELAGTLIANGFVGGYEY